MSFNRIRKSDINNTDIVDAYELISDGYSSNSIFLSTTCVSTSNSKTIVVGLASDGQGISNSQHPIKNGDIVRIYDTSGNSADGYYTVDNIINTVSFTVKENINNSTDGYAEFRYQSGASQIGYNNQNKQIISTNNLQDALSEIDTKALDEKKHQKLRQLIHLADKDGVGGPFEGFASGAYNETTYPPNSPFFNGRIWYTDNTKQFKIVENIIIRNSINMPITITWKTYDVDGVTVLSSITDNIVYTNNIFETSRTRIIS